MTDALNGRALLSAVLAFLLVLSVLAGVGAYASNVHSACDGTDAGPFLSQVRAFHSDDGCEVTGTAYTR